MQVHFHLAFHVPHRRHLVPPVAVVSIVVGGQLFADPAVTTKPASTAGRSASGTIKSTSANIRPRAVRCSGKQVRAAFHRYQGYGAQFIQRRSDPVELPSRDALTSFGDNQGTLQRVPDNPRGRLHIARRLQAKRHSPEQACAPQ